MSAPSLARRLFLIRLVHTIAWAIFAGAILAVPLAIFSCRSTLAMGLSLLVWGEVTVLVANGMRCPLTKIAARYTEDRTSNFDIFLPVWLARWNQLIFGSLFAASQLYLLISLVS